MPTPNHQQSRKRVPKPHQRRALALLVGCGDAGCTEAVMLLHGFTVAQLAELVRDGFAATTTEPAVGDGQQFDIARFKITEAGRQTLGNPL
jgi:hypothetical protein